MILCRSSDAKCVNVANNQYGSVDVIALTAMHGTVTQTNTLHQNCTPSV
jgi:hypothetical protein